MSAKLIPMLKTYAFADEYLITDFRRAINHEIVKAIGRGYYSFDGRCKAADWTFRNIPLERPLPQCLADEYCVRWGSSPKPDSQVLHEAMMETDPGFLLRVMRALKETGGAEGIQEFHERRYEEHDRPSQNACGKKHMVWYMESETGQFVLDS
ncbi:hypothetical protein BU23DRAFT_640994 [Bimuria novae-zelandiae CBS 107.79]|uniref:Uncharacterized protein n=1 Tax=Bimuria novae-zelandiae CBS 107.79 TaxID=1447943 RepID=A0A6A5VDV9_9PLEO|nr:hypothetical protein BU23DRAFT_640994 [Bimuria novae-zelandiae CBS 107.79]